MYSIFIYYVLAKIAQIIFSKETFYLHISKVFRLQGLIQKLGLGGLIISGWSDGLDCESAINTVSTGRFGLSGWIAGFP